MAGIDTCLDPGLQRRDQKIELIVRDDGNKFPQFLLVEIASENRQVTLQVILPVSTDKDGKAEIAKDALKT